MMNNIKIFNKDCLLSMGDMQNDSMDVIITDPPYGVDFKNDFYNDSEQYVFDNMSKWYTEMYRILKPNCFLFMFVGVKTIHQWIQKGIEAGFEYKNILAARSFNNNSPTPKNNFGFQFQPILVFSKGKGKPFNQVDFIPTSEEWFKDKRNKNPKPYTYAYPNWIKSEWCFATAKNSKKNLHPNEKNVDLIKFLVELSTKENEVVFDPFLGCGTTAISAIKLNRKFVGCEIDNNYYKIIKERINEQNKFI